MDIFVKYLTDEIDQVSQAHPGEWIDLRSSKLIALRKGDFTLIPLGVIISVPSGYESILVPRSSTFKKYGIIQTNGIGVIDHLYCGPNDEWKMPVYATRDTVIPANTRICQFRIIPSQEVTIRTVNDVMQTKSRGGFGSTGD